jgi:NodT family efflux transporter outer membrane factor (OMF) lipoprotein
MLKKILISILIFTNSCTLAPKHKEVETNLPFAENETKNGAISWQNFFENDELKQLITKALKNNYNLEKARLNIESARAIHGISRANLMPQISANSQVTRQGVSGAFANFMPETIYRANIGFTSYELDFFGRVQSLKKAALEDYLASIEAKNLIEISLIAEVANAYIQLALDLEILEIANKNLEILAQKEKLINLRQQKGLASKIDLGNARAELENAKINFENYQNITNQDKNALMTLVSDFDENNLPKILPLNEIKIAENNLEFLPSKNLLSRFDIKQAEHNLRRANANIGAARAAFFPSISLTGAYGYQSLEATDLFNSKNWSITPQINLPIFSGGRNSANLENANILKKIEIINYRQTIQNAFAEVLDKISEKKSLNNQLQSSKKILIAKAENKKSAQNKQKLGLINKLDLMTFELDFLNALQNNLLVNKSYFVNLIESYKALGGGSEIKEN